MHLCFDIKKKLCGPHAAVDRTPNIYYTSHHCTESIKQQFTFVLVKKCLHINGVARVI